MLASLLILFLIKMRPKSLPIRIAVILGSRLTKVEAFGMWKAIPYVTSGLSLVAFIVAVGAWMYNRRLKSRERLIESAKAENRLELIKKILFDIDTSRLTP